MQRIKAHNEQLNTSSNISEKDLLLQAIDGFDPDTYVCQGCGAVGFMKITSTYRRHFTTVVAGRPFDDDVMIPCACCESCGGYYHAVLPDILIPFGHFTLLFILTVLEAYVNRTCTVAEVCGYWQISPATLYHWKHRFLLHHDLWRPALERIRRSRTADDPTCNPESSQKRAFTDKERPLLRQALVFLQTQAGFIRAFFLRFLFSFLQGCHRTHLKKLPAMRHF